MKGNTIKKIEMENLQKRLKGGEELIFDNENFCEEKQLDEFRTAECSFRNEVKNSWANGFKIDFNGKLFSFKTFPAFEKKLNQLINDWNLELKEN